MTDRQGPPDIEAILVAELSADTALTTILTGADRISTALPDDLEKRLDPGGWLQLGLLAGSVADPRTSHLYALLVQGAAWAAYKLDAFDVVEEAVRAFLELEGYAGELGVVTATELNAPPYWSPDPETNLPRYVFTGTAYAHRAPVG